MVHMLATEVSRLDLHAKADDSCWRWLGIGRPIGKTTTATLATRLPEGTREYLLCFPLYNGVTSVEFGAPEGRTLKKVPSRPEANRNPVVVYGTSTTQGGCVSRPGMVHTAILGRWFSRPFTNLGFSGNGKVEPEVADLLAELDPAVYVPDCLPNMNAQLVTERIEPSVRTLRKSHPDTPIMLAEDRTYANAFLLPSQRQTNTANHAAHDRLIADGVIGLHYLTSPGSPESALAARQPSTAHTRSASDSSAWPRSSAACSRRSWRKNELRNHTISGYLCA